MTAKSESRRMQLPHQTGPTPIADNPENIRNVVLVGHTAAGKTTLVEALLAATGAIPTLGSVSAGTTVTDSDPSAIKQQRSVSLSVAPTLYNGIKINLLDTPGYGDFVAELRAGLRAADAALFVISAVDGVDAATIALWHECAAVAMPRAIVVTHLNKTSADFDAIVAICQRVFGNGVSPLGLPIHDDGVPEHPVVGVLDLLHRHITDYGKGQFPPRYLPTEPAHDELVAQARNNLIEAIIAESEDENLLDKHFSGELGVDSEDAALLGAELRHAVARGSFFPVLPVESVEGVGLAELLSVITESFGSPLAHEPPVVTGVDGSACEPITADPTAPLVAEVVKTTTDPHVGRVSLVRVFAGTLRSNDPVYISGHGSREPDSYRHNADEQISRIYSPLGATLRNVPFCVAGDICAITTTTAQTGDTISVKTSPLMIAAWPMPEPLLPIAIVPATAAEEDWLTKLASGDPSVRIDRDSQTSQLVVWCMGPAHAEVILDRLRSSGVAVSAEPVRVALRETFTKNLSGHGRYVKQSQGHGQFGSCDIEVEPLSRGAGIEFVNDIVGGVISQQFISAVEKGVRSAAVSGPAGHPIVDFRVRLVDVKMPVVDLSEAAFSAAGAAALHSAAENATCVLEPVDAVTVRTPESFLGPVLSDIASRRGHVLSTTSDEDIVTIKAEIPAVALVDYVIGLRAVSSGTATFSRGFLRYDLA